MSATYQGRSVTSKSDFLRLASDPKEAEAIEVRTASDATLRALVGLREGIHFIRIGKIAYAQVRVLASGRRVVS